MSRARANIEQAKVRHTTPVERQEQLLAAFGAAVTDGSTGPLAALLSDDIQLAADGGGKVPTVPRVLHGEAEVIGFIAESLREYWADYQWITLDINGGRGIVLRKDGVTTAAVSFAYDEAGRTTNIYIMRNPDKLSRVGETAIHWASDAAPGLNRKLRILLPSSRWHRPRLVEQSGVRSDGVEPS
ncbi:hypothetical protein [Virgifigura deserti]|uniref:hypothetical protein n=1 Tax=Virgifigura deserti TaxID=2268457 RepID=UPI003CCC0FB8